MSREHTRGVGQAGEHVDERGVQQRRITAIVAIAGAGTEQGVAADQRRRVLTAVALGEQTEMRTGMPGRIETAQFNAAPDTDHIAAPKRLGHARNPSGGACVGQHPRAGGGLQRFVAPDVVAVFVGIKDLPDGPAPCAGDLEA